MSAPQAFPLFWPAGKKRTRPADRKRASFKTIEQRYRTGGDGSTYAVHDRKAMTVATALSRLQLELDRLGASRPIVSTNVELRLDGLPRSGQRAPDDPGVAVYFRVNGDPVVLAVDQYTTVADNITAIAKLIEASRAIERYGVGTLKEIFRGYMALPAAIAPDDWRTLLDNPPTLAHAETYYRQAMRNIHPDVGGSEAQAAALNAAITAARKAFA
jgi:hypothetical protein